MWKAILLCTFVALTAGNKRIYTYENYKVYRILPGTDGQIDILKRLYINSGIGWSDFWTLPTRKLSAVDVMASPKYVESFEPLLDEFKFYKETMIQNVQQQINETMKKGNSTSFDFTSYHTLDEIYKNLDDLAEQYPDKVQVIVGGTTHEGRQIKGVKISFKPNKLGVFLEGGSNPREWISPATVMYIMHHLLTSQNLEVKNMAESYDWYIFPLFNPDGYVYTHTTNRLWKKTRKPHGACTGTDMNKNWDYQWNKGGASNYCCSNEYAGEGPFSEIETKSLSEYIKSIQDKFFAYFSFHSYSSEVMYPPSITKDVSYDDKMETIAYKGISSRMWRPELITEETNRSPWITKKVVKMGDSNSGSSASYIKGTYDKPFVFAYGLQNIHEKESFLQSPEVISTVGKETLFSLLDMLNEINETKDYIKYLKSLSN